MLTPSTIWRDFVVDGVPNSGPHNPKKSEIIEYLEDVSPALNISVAVDSFSTETIPSNVDLVRFNGYHVDGDTTPFLYKRVPVEPTHLMKLQDSSGAWFEYVWDGYEIPIEHGGAQGVQSGTIIGDAGLAFNKLVTLFDESGGTIVCRPLTYGFSTRFEIGNGSETVVSTISSIKLKGSGPPGTYSSYALQNSEPIGITTTVRESFQGSTVFHYLGGSNGIGFLINGPVTYDIGNFVLDCNYGCDEGIFETHSVNSYMHDIHIFAARRSHRLSAWTGQSLVFKGANNNTYERISTNNAGLLNGIGLDAGVSSFDNAPGLGVSQNYFKQCEYLVADDPGSASIILRGIDAGRFTDVYTFSAGAEQGQGILIIPPTNTVVQPNGNVFPTEITFTGGGFDNGISDPPANWNPQLTGLRGLVLEHVFEGDMFDPTRIPRGWPKHDGIKGTSKSSVIIGPPQNKHLLTGDITEDLAFETVTLGKSRAIFNVDTSINTDQTAWSHLIPEGVIQSYWVRDNNSAGGYRKDRILTIESIGRVTNFAGIGEPIIFTLLLNGHILGTVQTDIPSGTNFQQWKFSSDVHQMADSTQVTSFGEFTLSGATADGVFSSNTLELSGGRFPFFVDLALAQTASLVISLPNSPGPVTSAVEMHSTNIMLK